MKFVKQIAVCLLAVVFLLTSSGILIYQTDCICSGKQEVTFYISPDTCEDEFHVSHAHKFPNNEVEAEQNDCHTCSSHMEECGCSSPEIKYVRLVNQFTKKEAKFLKTSITVLLSAVAIPVESNLKKNETKSDVFYIDPPPRFASSTEFLIEINKLKIPELA